MSKEQKTEQKVEPKTTEQKIEQKNNTTPNKNAPQQPTINNPIQKPNLQATIPNIKQQQQNLILNPTIQNSNFKL